MRNLLSTFSVILSFVIILASCSNSTAQSRLEKEINTTKQKLPISLGKTGEIVDISYNATNNSVTYSMSIDDKHLYFLDMGIDIERLNHLSSENILLAAHGVNSMDIMKLIAENGTTLNYNYQTKFQRKSETFSTNITPEMLQKRLSSGRTKSFNSQESKQALVEMSQQTNAGLPMPLDDGFVAKQVKLENTNIVFVFELDAQRYSKEDIRDYAFIQLYFNNFNYDLKPLLFDCNYGVIMRVQMTNGQSKEIPISPFEVYTLG